MCSRETFYWPHVSTCCTGIRQLTMYKYITWQFVFFVSFFALERRWEWKIPSKVRGWQANRGIFWWNMHFLSVNKMIREKNRVNEPKTVNFLIAQRTICQWLIGLSPFCTTRGNKGVLVCERAHVCIDSSHFGNGNFIFHRTDKMCSKSPNLKC